MGGVRAVSRDKFESYKYFFFSQPQSTLRYAKHFCLVGRCQDAANVLAWRIVCRLIVSVFLLHLSKIHKQFRSTIRNKIRAVFVFVLFCSWSFGSLDRCDLVV